MENKILATKEGNKISGMFINSAQYLAEKLCYQSVTNIS